MSTATSLYQGIQLSMSTSDLDLADRLSTAMNDHDDVPSGKDQGGSAHRSRWHRNSVIKAAIYRGLADLAQEFDVPLALD